MAAKNSMGIYLHTVMASVEIPPTPANLVILLDSSKLSAVLTFDSFVFSQLTYLGQMGSGKNSPDISALNKS